MTQSKGMIKGLLMVVLLFAAQLSYAQCDKLWMKNLSPEQRVTYMIEKVGLTPAQAEKAVAINIEFSEKRIALFEAEEDWESKHTKIKELNVAQKEAFETIFSSAQIENWASLHGVRGDKHGKDKGVHWKHHKRDKGLHGIPRSVMGCIKELDKTQKSSLKTELKNFHKTTVFPVIRAQRAKLDQYINTTDQRILTELRMGFEGVKAEFKALKTSTKEEYKSKEDIPEEVRAEFKALKTKKHELMGQLKPLLEEYGDEMKQLHEELKPQKEAWRMSTKDIVGKYVGTDCDLSDFDKAPHEHGGKGHDGKKGDKEGCDKGDKKDCEKGDHHRKHHHKKMARFLLMDPANSNPEQAIEGEVEENEIQIFPNPSQQANTIAYTVRKAGNVKIDLLTRNGVLVKTVMSEYKEVGTYKLPVNLSNLRGEIYFYRVVDGVGATTERFLLDQ